MGFDPQEKERSAFEQVGWLFVRPSDTIARSIARGEPVTGAAEVRRDYRSKGGRTLIGTDRMTVRLAPGLDEEAVVRLLIRHELEVVNRLRFAPNLFEVTVPRGVDPLGLSVQLQDNESFVYAEPEFIEHIPPRWRPIHPDYVSQWHLHSSGQYGGTAGADVSNESSPQPARAASAATQTRG